MSIEQALVALNAWLAERGMDVDSSTADAWNMTPYRDGVVFSAAGGARSNVLYLVANDSVAAFAPSTTSIEEAYASLHSDN